MGDNLPEKRPGFGSISRERIRHVPRSAEEFEKECRRRADAMGMKEFGPGFKVGVAIDCLGLHGLPISGKVHCEILKVVKDRVPAALMKDRLWDAVVAYGCGWARKIEDDASGWDGWWPRAAAALEAMVVRAMESANFKLLRSVGLGGSDVFDLRERTRGEGIPFRLVMQMARPLFNLDKGQRLKIVARHGFIEVGRDVEIPPGGKHVIEVGSRDFVLKLEGESHLLGPGAYLVIACCDGGAEIRLHRANKDLPEKKIRILRLKPDEFAELCPKDGEAGLHVRECTCGTVRCADRHRLSSWDPAMNSLIAFVAAAVKGLKPKRGKTLPGIVSLQQGMLFQHYNSGVETLLGEKKHLINVRLRMVPAAAKECTCGAEFLENSCSDCGSKFDPSRMKIVKKKAFLILEGIDSDSQTRLEKIGRGSVRRGFLRCNRKDEKGRRACDNHFELADTLLTQQAKCEDCGRTVLPEDEVKKLLAAGGSRLQILRRLQEKRRRLVKKETQCAHCGANVQEIPVQCPICKGCQLGQNLVFLYERRPPQLIRKVKGGGSRDGRDEEDDDGPGEDDPGPKEEV